MPLQPILLKFSPMSGSISREHDETELCIGKIIYNYRKHGIPSFKRYRLPVDHRAEDFLPARPKIRKITKEMKNEIYHNSLGRS